MRTKGPKRRYSDQEVAHALAYVEQAPSIKAASEDLNLPIATLHSWQSGRLQTLPDSALCESAKQDLAKRFEGIAHKALDFADGKMEGASFAQLMTGSGIATDKMLLLRGEATSITSQTLTEQEAIDRSAAILAKAAETLKKMRAAQAQDNANTVDAQFTDASEAGQCGAGGLVPATTTASE